MFVQEIYPLEEAPRLFAERLSIHLPAGAVNGDTIILSNTGAATNNIIARNGKTIMGVAEDMTFDFTGHTVTLKCIGSDWRIV